MISRHARSVALAAAIAAIVAAPAVAEDDFVRVVRGKAPESGALQTAHAVYRSGDGRVEVVLEGAVHMADRGYYRAIQERLDAADAVLFEGVKADEGMKPTGEMLALSELQKGMADLFGFAFQKDGIDYRRDHFIHADMTAKELSEAAGGDLSKLMPGMEMLKGANVKSLLPIMKLAMQFGKAFLDQDPAMRDRMKLQFASQLGNADVGAMMQGEAARLILYERNKACFKVLDAELAKGRTGRIAIFYGAAHLPDMERMLGERGFRLVEKKWDTAWRIGRFDEAEGDGEGAPEPEARPAPAPRKGRKGLVYY